MDIDDDDVNEVQRGQSYAALLQSLGVDSSLQHRKKRRRLEHVESNTVETINTSIPSVEIPSSINVDNNDEDVDTVNIVGHNQTTGSEV